MANTQGASGIGGPLADGQTLYHVIDSSNAIVVNYVDLAGTYGGDPSNYLDISYFVNEAPEPATAGLMAIASLVLLGRRARATRA